MSSFSKLGRAFLWGALAAAVTVAPVGCGRRQPEDTGEPGVRPDNEPIGKVTSALALNGGIRVLSDTNSLLSFYPTGGVAAAGVAIQLKNNCLKTNANCRWMYRQGMIVSMADTRLALRGAGVNLGNITLSDTCTAGDVDCHWLWKKGVFYSKNGTNLMINAAGGAVDLAPLKLNTGCTENNTDCLWTLENAPITSALDSSMSINAFGGATEGTVIKYYQGCPTSNTDCTWTFKQGLIRSDTTPSLAIFAGDDQSVTLRGSCTSAPDARCEWRLDGGQLFASSGSTITMHGSADPATGVTLVNNNNGFQWGNVFDVGVPPAATQGSVTNPTGTGQKQIGITTWENTSLVVPDGRAGCATGRVFFGAGNAALPTVTSAALSCVYSTTGTSCPLTTVTYNTPGVWPPVSRTGITDTFGNGDNQLIRLYDKSLLFLHQGSRKPAGFTMPPGSPQAPTESQGNGTEYFFRSTDCGTTWSLRSIVDPTIIGGPPSHPSRYASTAFQWGLDRPEIYADPYNPGRVYMVVGGNGDGDNNSGAQSRLLYRSYDNAATWSFIGELPNVEVNTYWAYMTTLQSGLLYIVGNTGSHIGLIIYSPGDGILHPPIDLGPMASLSVVRVARSSHGVARVGSFSDGDYLRIHNTELSGSDYRLAVRLVRVFNFGATVVQTNYITPPAGYSYAGATSVETDRLDFVDNLNVNPSMLYWYTIKTSPALGDYGPAEAQYTFFMGKSVAVSGPGCVSETGNTCRTWPVFNNVTGSYGDYMKGAFWFEEGVSSLNFLAFWGEQTATGEAMETNYLKLPIW